MSSRKRDPMRYYLGAERFLDTSATRRAPQPQVRKRRLVIDNQTYTAYDCNSLLESEQPMARPGHPLG